MASLISLDEKEFNKATALEITAGGRLYNVVVDNELVGKNLLQHGKLKKRVTIIPLNKINTFKMSQQVSYCSHVALRLALTFCFVENPSRHQACARQGQAGIITRRVSS